jgi:peptidoglycan/LPS O-acetylase OafA/YrhL
MSDSLSTSRVSDLHSSLSVNSGSRYRSDIDGLRAISVLAVVIFHAHLGILGGGFTGVDVFFVISGFLIGGHILAEEMAGTFTYASFYRRRAKRILPALFCVLTFTLLSSAFLFSPLERLLVAKEGIATLLSVSNLYYWHAINYFAVCSELRTLMMTWSLGVEEQFYIFAPLLIVWLLRRRSSVGLTLTTLTLLSFALSSYQVFGHPNAAFYLLPSRIWELCAGVLLAWLLTTGRGSTSKMLSEVFGVLGLLLVLLPMCFLSAATPFPGMGAVPTVAGAVMLCFAGTSWVSRTILSIRPLTYVGRISYSFYLWHWPLLVMTRVVLGEDLTRPIALKVLGLAFALSVASYHLVEQPFRKSETATRPLLLRYAAASAVLICIFAGVAVTHGLRIISPKLAIAEDHFGLGASWPCLVDEGASKPDTSASCIENSGRPVVALWGDSHAESVSHALRAKAHESGYDFFDISKGTCPPLKAAGLYAVNYSPHGKECMAFNDTAVALLAADKRVRVVILTANWKDSFVKPRQRLETDRGWIVARGENNGAPPAPEVAAQLLSSHLDQTIRTLEASGKRVILMQDVAMFSVYPTWHVLMEYLPVRRWAFGLLRPGVVADTDSDEADHFQEDKRARALIQSEGVSTGSSVFDLEAALCTSPGTCRYRLGDDVLYTDSQHLSPAGASFALRRFRLERANVMR